MFRCLVLTLFVAGSALSVAAQNGPACHPKLTNDATVSVPGNAYSVLPTEDGCWVFVLVHPPEKDKGGGLSIIDLRHGSTKFSRTIKTPFPPLRWMRMALTHDGRFLMLTGMGGIVVYDVRKLTEHHTDSPAGEYRKWGGLLPTTFTDIAITPDDRTMFVWETTYGTVSVIDLAQIRAANFQKFEVTREINVGSGEGSLALSEDGHRLYALARSADQFSHWKNTCRPRGAAATAAPDHPSGLIAVIDTEKAVTDPNQTHSVLTTTAVGCDPGRMIIDKDGRRVYVSSPLEDKVQVFDGERLTSAPARALLGSVPTRSAPFGLALVDGGGGLAVANLLRFSKEKKDAEGVSIIDMASIDAQPKISARIPTTDPVDIAQIPGTDTLVIANYGSEQVTFVSLGQHKEH